ncbi:MAG TPA: MoxR family ATPase [Acidimicrobiales bacterium]|nr:MoxR family ATPase [Acidimicrobiales bacterium]
MSPRTPRTKLQSATDAPSRRRSTSSGSMDPKTYKKVFDSIVDNVETVIKGKDDVVRLALVAVMCEGHILFEDLPGTGKSMLARALGQSISASDSRIQCTPDMLPGDITGSSILDQRKGTFEFRPGPVFANILLADEINRATPKTQSALLEAMAERKVTADGTTYKLPRPFLVLATQNPIEQAGTFPLPEAQLDRFLFKLSMGYMDRAAEFTVMFDNAMQLAIEDLGAVVEQDTVQSMIEYASNVEVSDEVGYYIVDLVQATREDPSIAAGGSPRATIALLRASRVLAASDGRTHVFPDDVRAVLRPVLAHRVILNPDAVLRGDGVDAVLERVTSKVKPPMSGSRDRESLASVVGASA